MPNNKINYKFWGQVVAGLAIVFAAYFSGGAGADSSLTKINDSTAENNTKIAVHTEKIDHHEQRLAKLETLAVQSNRNDSAIIVFLNKMDKKQDSLIIELRKE